MITITVQRRNQNDICTTGIFTAVSLEKEGIIEGYTLELPWKNNQQNISCIPAGKYKAYIRSKESSKWDYDVIQLIGVPGRSAIQFHSGNKPKNTNGCILTGTSQGKNAVWKSRDKLRELVEFCRDDEITVIIKKYGKMSRGKIE